eukprot:TRINITY_DN853_c0_g2_i1.p1 TRINITY_DN853_c0_g2~~TRINITY_DN853_c0_g2_i1.p1  ORF type:complete len:158 (-),score=20.00 TRINITY_DN853_c0_g2_i1:101-553(-)
MSSFSQQARQRIQQGLEGPEGEAVNANSTLLPHIEGLYETEEQKAERIRRARVRSRISAVMWGVAAYFTFTLSDIYQVTMNDPRVDWIALWLSIICSSVFLGIGFYLVVWLPRTPSCTAHSTPFNVKTHMNHPSHINPFFYFLLVIVTLS